MDQGNNFFMMRTRFPFPELVAASDASDRTETRPASERKLGWSSAFNKRCISLFGKLFGAHMKKIPV